MTEKLKNIFQFIVGIATIISCGAAIVGVMQVVRFVVEVRPVVNEFQRLIDTVVVYQNIFKRDSVIVRERVAKSDTVVVYRDVFKLDTVFVSDKREKSDKPIMNVSDKKRKRIEQNEKEYRERHSEFFRRE